jgi:small RNA 2'-O-methyltransferase
VETELHRERLESVRRLLVEQGARTVLDLGCGSGVFLECLLPEPHFAKLVGLDSSIRNLREAEARLRSREDPGPARLELMHGSFSIPGADLGGFDAAVMIETIEHVPPQDLSGVERTVFATWAPSLVVVTTPNREYNQLFGIAEGGFRHPDHQFEWCRARFHSWASGVAVRNGYQLECRAIGPRDPILGSPTQMGVFVARSPSPSRPS